MRAGAADGTGTCSSALSSALRTPASSTARSFSCRDVPYIGHRLKVTLPLYKGAG